MRNCAAQLRGRGAKAILVSLSALAFLMAAAEHCSAHDISVFDVGTRITIWVTRDKVQLGFLVELKNFPAQDYRKNCDLNKDMKIDDNERGHYMKECCKKFIDNLHVRINGEEMSKTITRTEVYSMVGDVGRDPFSTYIEAELPLDRSLYRVKIEYVNDNFCNEEPQIINDVNLSISKELDNLDIRPITPIVQYMDREFPDHLFMEMTLDRHFFIEFGYKDIGTSHEPFTANEIMLARDSGQTSRQAKSGTPAPTSSKTGKRLYKWLQDYTMTHVEKALKGKGAGLWLWLVLIGVVVGMIHVFLPGHGKGVVASYVVATHAKVMDAVKLSLLVTVFHTISTMVLAAFIMLIAERLVTTIQNVAIIYLTLISGALIVIIGAYMLFFFKPMKWLKADEKEGELVEETVLESGKRKSRFSLMWKVALATGIIPCITSSYASTLFIFYREYLKAFLMILFIALGQAITLSVIGASAAGGFRVLKWFAAKEKSGMLMWLVQRLHRPTAIVLIVLGVLGVWMGWQFLATTKAVARPMTAEERITAYEKTLQEEPGDFDANFNLGLLCAAKDELEKAAAHFEKASEAKPEEIDCLRFQAHALSKQEKYEKALKRYEEALKRYPEDSNLLFNMACVEQKLGREKEAIEHYKQAAQAGESKANFNLAIIYEKQSRLDAALKHYMRAMEARSDDMNIRMAIANISRNMKRYDKTVENLLIVHEKNPNSKEVNLALANMYLRRLEQEEAAKPFVEAYLEHGGREEIEAGLKELKGQKLTTPSFQKWSPPEAAKKFERIGACAVPFLEELAEKQTGEQLKTTLAAIAATEAPQALPCIISILNDTERWTGYDLFAGYGPEFGTPPIPVVANEAFLKCVRKSVVPLVVSELIKVMGEANNREYFLKQIYLGSCVKYPVDFMEAVLAYAATANKDSLRRAVELALYLKGEALSMADDPETLKSFVSYVTRWWKENKDNLVWDKTNCYFRKKEEK